MIENKVSVKEIKPNMIFDDLEIEDIPFKAINEGLGFHHNAKSSVNDIHVHKKVYEKAINKAEDARAIPSELNAFYNTQTTQPKVNREISIAEIREREVGYAKRFLSFVIDLLVTTIFCSTLLGLMFISTNLNLQQFVLEIGNYPVVFFPIVLFVLLYNVYSIAFGFSQTLGQKLFSIKNKFPKDSSVIDICKRTQLELLSLLLLGLPYFFKLDAKLFGNKVVTK